MNSTAPAHLLLVDDDRLILTTLAGGLRASGYRVSTAESVDDAQALLTSGVRPDLAVLDMHMPGRDGLELAPFEQWLAQQARIASISVTPPILQAVRIRA